MREKLKMKEKNAFALYGVTLAAEEKTPEVVLRRVKGCIAANSFAMQPDEKMS